MGDSLLKPLCTGRNCHKDFCDCVVEGMKLSRKRSRDRNVNGTLTFLKKNKITFIDSKIQNVVVVNPKTDNILLSLKKDQGKYLKVKYSGSPKWYKFSKPLFIEKFKCSDTN